MTALLRAALALLMGASLVLCALPAAAQAPAAGDSTAERLREARGRFERGIELYEEGDMDAALVELRRAYELAPSYKLLFNVGQVYLQKSDYASALDAFERYLAQGGENIPAKRRRELEALTLKLRQRVADLTVSVNVAGAEILVDDLPRGTSPLKEPLLINAGRRKISAQALGRMPASKTIEVAGTESVSVSIELVTEKIEAPAPVAEAPVAVTRAPEAPRRAAPKPRPEPLRPRQKRAEKPFPWVAWLATGALATGAIAVGAIAYDASRDLERKRSEQGVSRKDLDDATERTEQLALAADIVGGAAVLTGALSLYLTLSGGPARYETSQGASRGWVAVSASGRF